MKLIIDIPEQMYLNAKADMLCGAEILVNAIKNGTPHENVTEFADRCRECGRENVLDKIRAEIVELIDWHDCPIELDGGNDLWFCEACNRAIEIIDKYKAERSEE